MNPFASLEQFEVMRGAALGGEAEYARFRRREATEARRVAGRHVEIRLSARVQRMVRLAVASARAVLLVGPPGTGKTEILEQLIAEMDRDPARFGFRRDEISASWVTPEEEWTFDKIVLGETVVGTNLVSVEGDLLAAIAADDWLVLDETNRADMDRVLGGVLTWLSGKRVRVGAWRQAGADEAVPVFLDWSDDATSSVLEIDGPASSRVYRAGTDWRVLGTYNAVDAQRVFRMGQALGRRFKHVPVPPASEVDFRTIIEAKVIEGPLQLEIVRRISSLYGAHLSIADTQLGPGLFVDMPAYIDHGFRMSHEVAQFESLAELRAGEAAEGSFDDEAKDSAEVGADGASTGHDDAPVAAEAPATAEALDEGDAQPEAADAEPVGSDSPPEASGAEIDAPILADEDQLLDELTAEAYLISVGNLIAKYEADLLEELTAAVLSRGAVTHDSWRWIVDSLTAMRA